MKVWLDKALQLLQLSLTPPCHEMNELDWKLELSADKRRVTEHLSAFANLPGGGFLVFGIESAGIPHGITQPKIESLINHLANLGRDGLEPPLSLDHIVHKYSGAALLFVHIKESDVKPVHLRSKTLEQSYIRSGGTTRLASRQEVGTLMLHSRIPHWEELHASVLLKDDELVERLLSEPILKMLERPMPTTQDDLLSWMASEKFVKREPSGGGYVTNMGAIAAARKLENFPELTRKAVRVIVYEGVNKAQTKLEQEGARGYGVSFQSLLNFVMSLLPQSEVIEQALREKRTIYPELALREIIANALIHQDFSISGTGPMIEIFANRVEVSNPGGLLPSKQLDRLIGTQPESRNEQLARSFRRYKICEERGSGLLKAGLQIELYGLPPIKFDETSHHFKVSLFAPRTFSQMSPKERLDACYQHAVLKYFSSSTMTNTSLRERLKMPEKQRSMVSVLIQEALDTHLVKPADPENRSKKFSEYIPFWA